MTCYMAMQSYLNTQTLRTTWKKSDQTPKVAVWPVNLPKNRAHINTQSTSATFFFWGGGMKPLTQQNLRVLHRMVLDVNVLT
jgi:hypothetical protein